MVTASLLGVGAAAAYTGYWAQLQDTSSALPYPSSSMLLPTGALLSVLSGAAATTSIPGYRMSPSAAFQGGMRFVLLQLIGWLTLGTTGAVSLWYAAGPQLDNGVTAIGLGVPAFVADVLLIRSASHFQRDSLARFIDFVTPSGYLWPSVLSAAALLVFGVADAFHSRMERWVLVVLGCCLMLIATLYIHLKSAEFVPGYRLFQPFAGGDLFVLVQAVGWMLFAAALNLIIYSVAVELPRGALLLSGLFQLGGNALLLVSLLLFKQERESSARQPAAAAGVWWMVLSRAFWGCGVVACLTPLLVTWLELPRWALLVMFLSPPLVHLSGSLRVEGYRLIQPLEQRGGTRFVTAQAFGWLLYGLAAFLLCIGVLLHVTLPDSSYGNAAILGLGPVHLTPIIFCAQALISISQSFFVNALPDATASPAQKLAPTEGRKGLQAFAVPLWVPGVLVVVIAVAMGLANPTTVRAGWTILAVLVVITAAGLHLLWTHWWLIASAAIVMTGNNWLLAVAAMLGLNISVTWYTTMWVKRTVWVPGRALYGWSYWVFEDMFGGGLGASPIRRPPRSFLMVFGFILTDLGVHLIPALVLLQMAAEAQAINSLSVVAAYVASRLWSLSITTHHLTVDWEQLHESGECRLLRLSQTPTAYVDRDVINLIYGVKPPAPPNFFHFAVVVEAASAASCALVTIALDEATACSVFMKLGGGDVISVAYLTQLSFSTMILGGVTMVIGTGYSMVKQQQGTGSDTD